MRRGEEQLGESSSSLKKPRIDEVPRSQQLALYGRMYSRETLQRLFSSHVLISGMQGLGVEIAKNLILAGVKSVTFHDDGLVEPCDLSSNFVFIESDVGKNRALASAEKLQELNTDVVMDTLTCSLTTDHLSHFQAVVFTDIGLERAIEFNDYCHSHQPPIYFIKAEVRGPFGSIFCDFGPEFTFVDDDDVEGEDPHTSIIKSISNDIPALVSCFGDERLKFQDGDLVEFSELQGMAELNDGKPRKIKDDRPHSFTLEEDTTKMGTYMKGGIVTQVKLQKVLNFKPLREALKDPVGFVSSAFSKFNCAPLMHLAFQVLDKFLSQWGHFPVAGSESDASKLTVLGEKINEGLGDGRVEDINPEILRHFAIGAKAVLIPMAAMFGGIVGQEVVKACSGKFHPLFQFFYFDSLESLAIEDLYLNGLNVSNGRCDSQISVFGPQLLKKLEDAKVSIRRLLASNVLISGMRGLGIEIAKNLILAGVKSITLHDEGVIERWDLYNIFVFTESHLGKNRALASALKLEELNNNVDISILTSSLTKDHLSRFQAVVFTDIGLEEAIELNDYCHSHQPPISFIKAEVRGLFGSIFCDFGPEFTFGDDDVEGEDPHTSIIKSISNDNPALVTCFSDERLKFQDGDLVVFSELHGMTELNDGKPRKIKDARPHSFTLEEDTTNMGTYKKGGFVTQVKLPKVLNFKPLREALENPGDFFSRAFSKFDRVPLLHLAFQGLDKFLSNLGRFPEAGSQQDAKNLTSLVASSINEGLGDGRVEDINPQLLRHFAFGARTVLNHMAAMFGAIVGQEVVKACSGKFHPLFQFFYFDSVELLPADDLHLDDPRMWNSCYDAHISVFGPRLQKKLEDAKVFMRRPFASNVLISGGVVIGEPIVKIIVMFQTEQIPILVQPGLKVEDLKWLLLQATRVIPNLQKLYLLGKRLVDHKTLSQYGVKNDSIVVLAGYPALHLLGFEASSYRRVLARMKGKDRIFVIFGAETIAITLSLSSTVKDLVWLLQSLIGVIEYGLMLWAADIPLHFNSHKTLRQSGLAKGREIMLTTWPHYSLPGFDVVRHQLKYARITGVANLSGIIKLKEISRQPWECGSFLTSLDISDNRLESLPAQIGCLIFLKELKLRNNVLRNDSLQELASLKQLTVLIASCNRFTGVISVGSLSSLTTLDIGCNSLTSFHSDIGLLKYLESLIANENRIISLPESIGGCTSLVEVDLRDNMLTELPSTFSYLRNLREFNLNKNALRNDSWKVLACLKLAVLTVRSNSFTGVLPGVGSLSSLTTLDISHNSLTSLPGDMGLLKRLKYLISRGNSINCVPESIGGCASLIEVDLSNNQLREIPDAFSNLRNLTLLNLEANYLKSLPEFLERGERNFAIFWGEQKYDEDEGGE